MAILLRQACDVCLEYDDPDDVKDSGAVETIIVAIDDTNAAIELCDEHRQSLVAPLQTLLQRHGRDTRRPLAALESDPELDDKTCPMCKMVSATRQGLSAHVRNIHDVSLSELIMDGRVPRRRGRGPNADRDLTIHECPDCGKKCRGTRGLRVHTAVHK